MSRKLLAIAATLLLIGTSDLSAQVGGNVNGGSKPNVSNPTGTLPVANGGTGATSAAAARTALGVTTNGSAAVGQLPGTTTNDAASAGNVGQIIESTVLTGAAITLTSNSIADITSVSLTAGDWDCWGNIVLNPAGIPSAIGGWIHNVSITNPTLPNAGARYLAQNTAMTVGSAQAFPVGTIRYSLASTTTIYLSTLDAFTSTAAAYGYLGCRRAR